MRWSLPVRSAITGTTLYFVNTAATLSDPDEEKTRFSLSLQMSHVSEV